MNFRDGWNAPLWLCCDPVWFDKLSWGRIWSCVDTWHCLRIKATRLQRWNVRLCTTTSTYTWRSAPEIFRTIVLHCSLVSLITLLIIVISEHRALFCVIVWPWHWNGCFIVAIVKRYFDYFGDYICWFSLGDCWMTKFECNVWNIQLLNLKGLWKPPMMRRKYWTKLTCIANHYIYKTLNPLVNHITTELRNQWIVIHYSSSTLAQASLFAIVVAKLDTCTAIVGSKWMAMETLILENTHRGVLVLPVIINEIGKILLVLEEALANHIHKGHRDTKHHNGHRHDNHRTPVIIISNVTIINRTQMDMKPLDHCVSTTGPELAISHLRVGLPKLENWCRNIQMGLGLAFHMSQNCTCNGRWMQGEFKLLTPTSRAEVVAIDKKQGSPDVDASNETCILQTPAVKLICMVSVGNSRWRALVDTGANMTIICHDVLTKLTKQQQQKLQATDVRILNVSGQQMAVEGKLKVKFRIADMNLKAECHVVTHLQHSIILGMDFLVNIKLQLT